MEDKKIFRDKLADIIDKIPDSVIDDYVAKICEKATGGDIKAFDWIISASGTAQSSVQADNNYTELPARLVGRAYTDIYRDIRDRRHRFYNFKGGRGSLKSSFCALVLVDEIMRNKNACAIALRQVKDTLITSVYAQVRWAIDMLGLSDLFEYSQTLFQIVKKDTGQIIYFRGCDDPVKIKSICPPHGMHMGVAWFEEKDQLKGSEAVRSILQSVMRGGDIIILSSYNTPISRRHFLNQEELVPNDKAKYHHSYYYDVPSEWLGQPFFDEAEYLKSNNIKAYNHEYLGDATGETGSVFENLELREVTREERQALEHYYYGVDWGFYPDPWAYIKCAYSSKDRVLYIIDEACEYKKGNGLTAAILRDEKRLTKEDTLICDSSEPKSISDYNKLGLRAIGAEKGSISGGSSVSYSMRWLQSLNKIIIDTSCPKATREFSEYEYEKDKDGEVISGYPDKNNHLIDAVRYACTMLWRR